MPFARFTIVVLVLLLRFAENRNTGEYILYPNLLNYVFCFAWGTRCHFGTNATSTITLPATSLGNRSYHFT